MSAAALALGHDALVAGLFPDEVLATASPIDADASALLPEERALVERAVPKRQREFATGRRCARELLAQIGHVRAPLLRDESRAPRWPAGVVGSISHCDTLCVAAVASAREVPGLGVDVEPDLALEEPLWSKICTPRELDTIVAAAPLAQRGHRVRWIFSAKEALYKCVHPHVRVFLGFQDAEIRLDEKANDGYGFEASLPSEAWQRLPRGARVQGFVAARAGHLVTAATLVVP